MPHSPQDPTNQLLEILLQVIGDSQTPLAVKEAFLKGLFTPKEREDLVVRHRVKNEIQKALQTDTLSIRKISKTLGVSAELVARVFKAMRNEYPPVHPPQDSFHLALPKESRALMIIEDILGEGDFLLQGKEIIDLTDKISPTPIRLERGDDMLTYMRSGVVQFALVGSDKTNEVLAEEDSRGRRLLGVDRLGSFRENSFRMCFAVRKEDAQEADKDLMQFLDGKKIATSYPYTLSKELERLGIQAGKVIHLKGNVEAAPRDLDAQAILDIVETGGSLKKNGLVCVSEISQCGIELFALHGRMIPAPFRQHMDQFCTRLVEGQQYRQ